MNTLSWIRRGGDTPEANLQLLASQEFTAQQAFRYVCCGWSNAVRVGHGFSLAVELNGTLCHSILGEKLPDGESRHEQLGTALRPEVGANA